MFPIGEIIFAESARGCDLQARRCTMQLVGQAVTLN